MALPDLPTRNPGNTYLMTGGTLNKIRDCIIKRTPIAGKGIEITELPNGCAISTEVEQIPKCPTADGTYILGADVVAGVCTLRWIETTDQCPEA